MSNSTPLTYSTGLLGPLIISSQVGAKKSPLESTVLKSTPVTIKFSLSHVSVISGFCGMYPSANILFLILFAALYISRMFLLELYNIVCIYKMVVPTDKLKCNRHNRSSSTKGMVTSLSQRSYILCYSTHLTTFVMALNPYTAVSLKYKRENALTLFSPCSLTYGKYSAHLLQLYSIPFP